jgi:hypothetical protein
MARPIDDLSSLRVPVMLRSLIAALFLYSATCLADTLYVAPSASAGGNGQSWSTAYSALGDALAKWQSGDEIWCAAGQYQVPQAGYPVSNGMRIYGGFKGNETLREQRDWYRQRTVLNSALGMSIFTLTACDSITRIDGFVLQGTRSAAVLVNGGSPRIFNNHFRACSTTTDGAAIRMNGGGRIQIEYCVFEDCRADRFGGAVYLNSDITSAAWNRQWGPFIGQCFFVNCSAQRGGGLYIADCPGTTQITSSVFAGNSAVDAAGAIGSESSDVYLNNSTFSRNTLTGSTVIGGKSAAMSAGAIQNCLMWNEDEDTTSHVLQLVPQGDTSKLVGRANVIERDFVYGFWQFAPDFVSVDDVDGADDIYGTDDDGLVLLPGSIGRDGGYLDTYVNHRQHDILGNPRLVGRKLDVGAYEAQREDGRLGFREAMAEMRKGGLVFMYRHGKTDWDQKDRGPAPECFPGRNLIAEGREQSDEIGKAQRMLGVEQGEALTSPACRCWETLKIMVGRYEERSYWAGGGGTGPTAQSRLRDLSTAVSNGNRFISTHDAVCQSIFNPNGGGEVITTAEYMEGDALIIRPLGGTDHEVLAQWCSETWTRYHVRFPDETTNVQSESPVAGRIIARPIPARDVVHLTSPRPVRLVVVDLFGTTVASADVDSTLTTSIDVSSWPAGTYFVVGGLQSLSFSVLH